MKNRILERAEKKVHPGRYFPVPLTSYTLLSYSTVSSAEYGTKISNASGHPIFSHNGLVGNGVEIGDTVGATRYMGEMVMNNK